MITAIIPVYNVNNYIDKCINSMLAQTYSDWELIIIDDGSTDGSSEKCERYAECDKRISYYLQKQSGPAISRNTGISLARGEWITFIDADDWVAPEYLRILLEKQKEHDVDIVSCQYKKTLLDSEEIDEEADCSTLPGYYERGKKLEDVFMLSYTPWGALFRASFLKSEGTDIFPDILLCEDYACLPYYFAKANGIEVIEDELYVWRQRTGSITHQLDAIPDRIRSLEILLDQFKKRGIFEENKDALRKLFVRKERQNDTTIKKMTSACYEEFIDEQRRLFDEHFGGTYEKPEIPAAKVIVLGGYTAYIVGKILEKRMEYEDLPNYYGPSSLIATMSKELNNMQDYNIGKVNNFRKKGILTEVTSRFLKLTKTDFELIDYILIDFSEERYDVGRCNDGIYVTLSEGFEDSNLGKELEYSVLEHDSEEFYEVWKKACDELVEWLHTKIPEEKIILLRTKQAEYYGEKRKECRYPYYEDIEKHNRTLDGYYEYFKSCCPGVLDISDLETMEEYYTDKDFRHGRFPWHLNAEVYSAIAKVIRNEIFDLRQE